MNGDGHGLKSESIDKIRDAAFVGFRGPVVKLRLIPTLCNDEWDGTHNPGSLVYRHPKVRRSMRLEAGGDHENSFRSVYLRAILKSDSIAEHRRRSTSFGLLR